MSARHLLAAGALVALTACAIGPDYERPELPAPAEFRVDGRADAIGPAALGEIEGLPERGPQVGHLATDGHEFHVGVEGARGSSGQDRGQKEGGKGSSHQGLRS